MLVFVSELCAGLIQEFIQPELFIYAERKQVEQQLVILMDNSLKYTNEGGQIWFRLGRNRRQIEMLHLRLMVYIRCE